MESRVAFCTMEHRVGHDYLADSWVLAQLCYGLVEFDLLQRKVLLVKPQQLLTLFVLVLQA